MAALASLGSLWRTGLRAQERVRPIRWMAPPGRRKALLLVLGDGQEGVLQGHCRPP